MQKLELEGPWDPCSGRVEKQSGEVVGQRFRLEIQRKNSACTTVVLRTAVDYWNELDVGTCR